MTKARDVALFFGGTLTNQIVTFASGVFVARWLGPADYGVLSLVRNVYGVAMILAPLGLDLSLLRHLGENGGNWPRSLAQISRFRMLAAGVNVAVLVCAAFVLGPWIQANVYPHPHFALYLGLALIALPFTADVAILTATLRALNKVSFQNLAALYLQPLVRVGALALFLLLGLGVGGVVAATAVGVAASSAAMSVALWWVARQRRLRPVPLCAEDFTAMKRVLGYSAWFMVTLFSYNILRNIDILVLGWFRPANEVGEYAALSTIAYIIQIFPLAVSQTLAPTVARHYSVGDLDAVRNEMRTYLRKSVLLSSPIYSGVAVFGPWLDLLFGARFHFSTELSFSLAFAYLVSGTLGQTGVVLTMTGRHRVELAVLLAGTMGALGGCFLLAPTLGGPGVALAVAVGYLFINGVRTAMSARLIGGLGLRLADAAPPLACLTLAVLLRAALERWLPHTLLVGAVGASLLLAAYALLYARFFLNSEEKVWFAAQFRSVSAIVRSVRGSAIRSRS